MKYHNDDWITSNHVMVDHISTQDYIFASCVVVPTLHYVGYAILCACLPLASFINKKQPLNNNNNEKIYIYCSIVYTGWASLNFFPFQRTKYSISQNQDLQGYLTDLTDLKCFFFWCIIIFSVSNFAPVETSTGIQYGHGFIFEVILLQFTVGYIGYTVRLCIFQKTKQSISI